MEVERLHADIRAMNTPLEQTPEVLKAVGVNLAIDILHSMVDHLMCIITFESVVGKQGICV